MFQPHTLVWTQRRVEQNEKKAKKNPAMTETPNHNQSFIASKDDCGANTRVRDSLAFSVRGRCNLAPQGEDVNAHEGEGAEKAGRASKAC